MIYLALVLVFCLCWASGFTSAKLALQTSPPALFGGIRFLIAGALLLGYAAWRGQLRGPIPWGPLALLGVLNQAGYQGLAWQGMGTVSAGLAVIIASLNPILIAAIAAPMLGERLHWRKVVGLLLGFGGAVFVVRHRIAGGAEDPRGVLLVIGALLSLVAGHAGVQMAGAEGDPGGRGRRSGPERGRSAAGARPVVRGPGAHHPGTALLAHDGLVACSVMSIAGAAIMVLAAAPRHGVQRQAPCIF